MTINDVGAVCFGIVVGWIAYRTIRRQKQPVNISDLSAVIGAVGGAAVTALFAESLFAYYSIGLLIGFFGYLVVGNTLLKHSDWLSSQD